MWIMWITLWIDLENHLFSRVRRSLKDKFTRYCGVYIKISVWTRMGHFVDRKIL